MYKVVKKCLLTIKTGAFAGWGGAFVRKICMRDPEVDWNTEMCFAFVRGHFLAPGTPIRSQKINIELCKLIRVQITALSTHEHVLVRTLTKT